MLGIAPAIAGEKSQLVDYPFLPEKISKLRDPSKGWPWWAWLLIGLAIAAVAVVVIVVVKKKKEENSDSGKGGRTQDVWDTMQDLRPDLPDNYLRRAMECMADQECEEIPDVQDLLAQIDPDYLDWIH